MRANMTEALDNPLQKVLTNDNSQLSVMIPDLESCSDFWDFENARFSDCASPYLSKISLAVLLLVIAGHLVCHIPLFKRWQPRWTKPFIEEEQKPLLLEVSSEPTDEQPTRKPPIPIWSLTLMALALLAFGLQLLELFNLSSPDLAMIIRLVQWMLLAVHLAVTRPRYSPALLLAVYLVALVAELAALASWSASLTFSSATIYLKVFIIWVSIIVIFSMPFRPIAPGSGPVSAVGSDPSNQERSPEDRLRLWQFLTVSWVYPILRIGKKRQLEKEDVWKLGYGFQTRRLADAFRQLRGSKVFPRLLKANALDCVIIVFMSLVQLFCDYSWPLLLQQLLLVMESPTRRTWPALTYALLLFARGILSAQMTVLSSWYRRRCYERGRIELIMLVYEKAVSRKIIVGGSKQESTDKKVGNNSEGTANGRTQDSTTKIQNGGAVTQTSNPSQETTNESLKKAKEKSTTRAAQIKLFKQLFWSTAPVSSKPLGPATTGQILNLVRSDALDVAGCFFDVGRLLKTVLGAAISVWLVCHLLGPSCLIGVLVVITAQLINAFLARIQVRWRRYLKQASDTRIQKTSQYLEVLRHLRWYAWQETWLAKVMATRQHEMNIRIVSMFVNLTIYFINVLAGGIFPVVAFFAYTALTGHELRIDLIFPALHLFESLASKLRELPSLVTRVLNAYVSMDRIEKFCAESEREERNEAEVGSMLDQEIKPIKLVDCSFAWPGTTEPIIRNINLEIGPGLTVVYGQIGSGKTALLQGLLNEMDQVSGHIAIPNEKIGYCSQTPWLQSLSIRDNILFFAPYEEERYRKVLDACALQPDFAGFKDGDLSHIGENGVGLSGGQRARVALARAMYSRTKIILLDDPLSALDHHTGQTVARKCFSEELAQDRIIVLVTHRTALVRDLAKQFVRVSDGQVLATSENPFSDDGDTQMAENDLHAAGDSETTVPKDDVEVKAQQYIEEEKREHGGIKTKVWLRFFRVGKWCWILLFIMVGVARVFTILQQWFFKAWGEAYDEHSDMQTWIHKEVDRSLRFGDTFSLESNRMTTLRALNPIDYLPPPSENIRPWLLTLLLVVFLRSVSLLSYGVSQNVGVYVTSKVMFAQALKRVTDATFRYYDITPIGRLMNRLTSDIQTLGESLIYLGTTVFYSSLFISSIVVIASISPAFLLFAAILLSVFVYFFRQFLPASRSLKRLETVSLSPLYTIFGELLQDQGLTIVRAFHAQSSFYGRVVGIVDQMLSLNHFYWSTQSWLTLRYEMIASLSTFLLTVIALTVELSPGMTAFMLLNAGTLVSSTHLLCMQFGKLQTEFISVERIVEVLEIDQEPEGTIQPPAAWPKFGSEITLEGVTVRYAPHLEPSLHDISLHIPGGSTTAIVGRTGSGKSTLAATLLNIVRADTGTVSIDNLPITDIDTNTLRRRVTFVPQDPILFSGTIRQNLDPIDEFTDQECEAVLSRVCAATSTAASTSTSSTPQLHNWTLDTTVESGGRNFSQGQRQLVGIARAVLRRSPVVIMDEATASIDNQTSVELQKILREELRDATIVTIAHKVEAVRGADWYVMMENGRVAREGKVDEEGKLIDVSSSDER